MSKEKILVTGCAGFIGFHLCKSLIDDGNEVFGVDNINDYYSINLKHRRLKELGVNENLISNSALKFQNSNKYKNFYFSKLDIVDKQTMQFVFNRFAPEKVIHLAAQPGVRYSLENALIYAETNLVGFVNIIDLCRENNVKGFIYASSSSVYGGNKKMPSSTEDRVSYPLSLYSATKRANELIAHSYSHIYGLHTTGLRYFTVYGPWGRPDMAIFNFAKNILANEPISVFNNGKMKRDFTYIYDIVLGTKSAIKKNYNCQVFNLGNNKSHELMYVISLIEKNIGKKAKINFLPMQPGDVFESFADIEKSADMLDYRPTININVGIKNFIKWYLSFKTNLS
ncbi:MAG: protein CapI [Candidatus Marinimicrobia bacterium]|nr:protein CapI [Candidatus Neomarinimicrobiota bacterium]